MEAMRCISEFAVNAEPLNLHTLEADCNSWLALDLKILIPSQPNPRWKSLRVKEKEAEYPAVRDRISQRVRICLEREKPAALNRPSSYRARILACPLV